MDWKNILSVLIMVALAIACSKDDAPSIPDPQPENKAPGTFALFEVMNGATNVELLPTLTWSTATDPDGDQVVYDVYLDTDNDPKTKVASDLSTTTFSVVNQLDLALDYYWKVVAKDGKGGETASSTFSFKSRKAIVTKIETSHDFSPRNFHASVVFQDRMWVMGGASVTGPKNDVYASSDGIDWVIVKDNDNGDFSRRRFHTSVVYEDAIYTIGGLNEQQEIANGIFRSLNGQNWSRLLAGPDFSDVNRHTVDVFRDKLWLLGGSRALGKSNQIWSSDNSFDWTLTKIDDSSKIFEPRSSHASVVFNDMIWIIGGQGNNSSDSFEFNDVWNSADGENWNLVTDNAAFAERHSHKVVAFDNKMWLIGGQNGTATAANEIWYSTDGKTWIDATPEESFTRADGFTTLVFGNKIWVIGGGAAESNVWTIE